MWKTSIARGQGRSCLRMEVDTKFLENFHGRLLQKTRFPAEEIEAFFAWLTFSLFEKRQADITKMTFSLIVSKM